MMKGTVQVSEITKKQQLLADKMAGHEGVPLGIAMLFESVNHLRQLRMGVSDVRELFEKALAFYGAPQVVKPTKDQIATIVGAGTKE